MELPNLRLSMEGFKDPNTSLQNGFTPVVCNEILNIYIFLIPIFCYFFDSRIINKSFHLAYSWNLNA